MNSFKLMMVLLFFFNAYIKADLLPEVKKKISYGFEGTNIDSFPVNQSNGKPNITLDILISNKALHLIYRFSAPVIVAVKNNIN